jgi:hypothetical protein
MSGILNRLLAPLQNADNSTTTFSKRQCINYVVTGFITGSCISRRASSSPPLCNPSIIASFMPIIIALRKDPSRLIRIDCLEMCAHLIGLMPDNYLNLVGKVF